MTHCRSPDENSGTAFKPVQGLLRRASSSLGQVPSMQQEMSTVQLDLGAPLASRDNRFNEQVEMSVILIFMNIHTIKIKIVSTDKVFLGDFCCC